MLGVDEFYKGVLNMFPQMRTSSTPNTHQSSPKQNIFPQMRQTSTHHQQPSPITHHLIQHQIHFKVIILKDIVS